ncbi:apolipoprotein N-acyltransferase [Loktanella sp. Alg231-35]|uniref:apolipoprotein N-acyltransferase n=1 Tax=Loktanella sp. Alg231-35 TaxID=1922220 RepID=UPI000D54BBD7|nr:apolipoprotein N-acyltransferase [Loktanella sp. Alg231-35]
MPDLLVRFASLAGWRRWLVLVVLGVLAGLGQAPFDLWPLTLLALAAVFLLTAASQTARQSAFSMWSFGFGYFAFCLHWIVEPFLVDVARHGWMAPFALVLMGGGAALFWALAGWVAHRVAPRNVLLLGLVLVGAEVLRALILTGFPWALLGHVWLDTGIAQAAAWGGPHLLSLLAVLCAWGLAALFSSVRLIGLVVIGLLLALNFVLQPGPMPNADAEAPLVRLVQPNAPQSQKWDPAYRDLFFARLLRLTGEGDAADLVVWPETSVPYLLNSLDEDVNLLADAARGAPLVFGIQRRDAELRAYNSMVVMGPGGELQAVYDKRHLVPFGEYMPGAALLGQAGATGLARSLGIGFTSGTVPGPLEIPGIGGAVPLICYEGIFAEEIGYGDARPRMLLLITNDAWFGQGAGPRQHLAQARLRAIEQGLPMVRVANTGISAMIDGRGRVTAALPLNAEGALDARLPAALPETFYAKWGDLPATIVLILLMILGYLIARRDSD